MSYSAGQQWDGTQVSRMSIEEKRIQRQILSREYGILEIVKRPWKNMQQAI